MYGAGSKKNTIILSIVPISSYMTKVTNRPNHSILYCIYFENKYVNVLEMDTHIFICYENERIEFMKIELSKIWIMYTIFNFYIYFWLY